MNFETIVFYMFSAITLLSGLRVITARNPVHAVLFLVLAFVSCAGIWMLLEAEFLAITLVLVYVGAVMVLFLFVVMMLDISFEKMREEFLRWAPFGALLAGLFAFQMFVVIDHSSISEGKVGLQHTADYSNTKELGRLIYTDYVYAFELAAVLLLVAMVAAIALTLRGTRTTKGQDISKQVAVTKAERLRVVAMPTEPKAAAKTEETSQNGA